MIMAVHSSGLRVMVPNPMVITSRCRETSIPPKVARGRGSLRFVIGGHQSCRRLVVGTPDVEPHVAVGSDAAEKEPEPAQSLGSLSSWSWHQCVNAREHVGLDAFLIGRGATACRSERSTVESGHTEAERLPFSEPDLRHSSSTAPFRNRARNLADSTC